MKLLNIWSNINSSKNGNADNSRVKFRNFVVINEMMEVTSIIGIDLDSVYHLGYPLF